MKPFLALTVVLALLALQAGRGPRVPADVHAPLRETFEIGTLDQFRSVVPLCVPGGCRWAVTASDRHAGAYAARVLMPNDVADQQLVQNTPLPIPPGVYSATLSFWHRFDFQTPDYDGGVIELSTDGGTSWTDAGAAILAGGYNGTIRPGTANPLQGRPGWIGTSGPSFTRVLVDLAPYGGRNVLVRLRAGSDATPGGSGWWLDDLAFAYDGPESCPPPGWTTQGNYYPTGTRIDNPGTAGLNGYVYTFGGGNPDVGGQFAKAYRYDPLTDSWDDGAVADLPAPRDGLAATTDGTVIYLLGGTASGTYYSTFWRYDPAANSYVTLTNYVIPTAYHAGVYLNGKVYRLGGQIDSGGTSTASVEAYDIAAGTWTMAAAYPLGVYWQGAKAYGGYLYSAGGSPAFGQGTAKAYRYDPAANVWDDAAMADLPLDRVASAVDIYRDRLIMAGGFVGGGVQRDAVAYDPAANRWTALAPNNGFARYAGGATGGLWFYSIGGHLIIVDRYYDEPCTSGGATPMPSPTGLPATSTPTATPTPSPTGLPATSTPTATRTPTAGWAAAIWLPAVFTNATAP